MQPLTTLTAGPSWRAEAMRSHRAHLLLWITRGQGRITVAGATRGFNAHNAIWVPAGTMHGMQVTSAIYGTACLVRPDRAPHDMPNTPLHMRIRDSVAQGALSAHLDDLQRESLSDAPATDRAIDCQLGLIAVWMERQREAGAADPAGGAAEKLVARYTALVERQVMTGQSVGDYAEALGVTVSHLTRACRTSCGRTAQDLLADRVAFEARRLLWDTDLPLKRISEMLGFNSPSYFTRAFQQRAQMTPSAFRETRPDRRHAHGREAPAAPVRRVPQTPSAPRPMPGWPVNITPRNGV